MKEPLPSLGRRGEGWFAGQVVLMAIVGVGGLAGPAWTGPSRIPSLLAGAVLIVAALGLGLRAMADLRTSFTPLPRPIEDGSLVDRGVYRLVRHPMYLAVVLGGLGWALVCGSLVSLAATGLLFVFFDLKSRREEAWLVEAYPAYGGYRERTRRIVPGVY